MQHRYWLHLAIATLLLGAPLLRAQPAATPDAPHGSVASSAVAGPPSATFVANRGQWDDRVRFLARWKGLNMWVERNSIVYDVHTDTETSIALGGSTVPRISSKGHVVRMRFVGASANANANAVGSNELPGRTSYLLGNDQRRWAAQVPSYERAVINDVYEGVSAVMYTDNGMPRYDLVLAPGADASAIAIAFDGATRTSVNARGELEIGTSVGAIKQQGLFAYQMRNGRKQQIPCSFRVRGNGTVSFALGAYNRSQPLVIDPVLFSTFIVADGYSRGTDIAVGADGKVYLTGFTGSANFPVSTGAYQTTRSGATLDAYVTVLSRDGGSLVYSTYLGGTVDDIATTITVDDLGNIYVAGYTFSADFPTKVAYDNTFGGRQDGFVAKLDPQQPGAAAQLVFSTYLGGDGSDDGFDFVNGIAVRGGQAYVTGYTSSKNFPVLNAYQSNPVLNAGNATGEAFITRFTTGGNTLVGSTLLGGDRYDESRCITFDLQGNVYICGITSSTAFPVRGVARAYDSTYNSGIYDAFVAKFTASLSTLLYSSYLGGSGEDNANAVAVDATGNMYLAGFTVSTDFPHSANAIDSVYNGGNRDMFAAKLSADGGTLLFGTYIGGNNEDWANDAVLDDQGNLWLAGVTLADNFPTTNNAIQPKRKGSTYDAALATISANGDRLIYCSYYGGTAADSAAAVALGTDGYLYFTGTTFSSNFPTTPAGYRPTAVGGSYATKLGVLTVSSPVVTAAYCAGDGLDITWTGASTDAYDIYFSADSGQTFTPVAFSVKGNRYTWFIPVGIAPGTKYRVKVSSAAASEADLSVAFTVNTPPKVSAQPASVTIPPGATAVFVAAATGSPAPSVQWQWKDINVWKDLPGETSTTLRLPNVTPASNGKLYRAVFLNDCRVAYSDSARLTVPSVQVLTPNGGEVFCAGETDTIRWSTVANTAPVNLRISSDGGFSYQPLAGNISSGFYVWNIPPTLSGTQFRIKVELVVVATYDSSDQNFTINTRPTVIKSPVDARSLSNGSVTFTAQGGGTPEPTVHWEVDSAGTWLPIPNATGTTLTLTNLQLSQNGRHYRAVFTNDCGSTPTDSALLTVSDEPGSVDERGVDLAARYGLRAVPSPMSGNGLITFTLPQAARTRLVLTDIRGTELMVLAEGPMEAGEHRVPLEARTLPSGVYLARLESGNNRATIRVSVVR